MTDFETAQAKIFSWLEKPYDPERAADAALAFPNGAEDILRRQSAFDPNLHLVVDDYFPRIENGEPVAGTTVVFCTQGHRFETAGSFTAVLKAEEHVKEDS